MSTKVTTTKKKKIVKKKKEPSLLQPGGSFPQAVPDIPIDIATITPIREMCVVGRDRVAKGGHSEVWTACKDGTVVIRDARSGEVVHAIQTPSVFAGCFAEVHSTNEVWIGYSDALVRVFEADDPYTFVGDAGVSSNIAGPAACIYAVNDSVAVGTGDGIVNLYEATTKRLLRRFVGHTAMIKSLAMWPERGLLFTGSLDKAVGIWKLAGDEENLQEQHGGDDAFTDSSPTRLGSVSPRGQTMSPRRVDPAIAGSAAALSTVGVHIEHVSPDFMFKEEGSVWSLFCDEVTGLLWVGTELGSVRAFDVEQQVSIKTFTLSSGVTHFVLQEDTLFALDSSNNIKAFDLVDTVQRGDTAVGRSAVISLEEVAKVEMYSGLISMQQTSSTTAQKKSTKKTVEIPSTPLKTGFAATFQQRSFNLVDAETQKVERTTHITREIERLEGEIENQKRRLELRRNPPLDLPLIAHVERSEKIEARLLDVVALHVKAIQYAGASSLRHKYFQLWRQKLSKDFHWFQRDRLNRFHKTVVQRSQLLRRWLQWMDFTGKRMETKRVHTSVASLQKHNSCLTASRYFTRWHHWQTPRTAGKQVERAINNNQRSLRARYMVLWRGAVRLLKERRSQRHLAGCLHRSLSTGVLSAYYDKWRQLVSLRGKKTAIERFLSAMTNSSNSYARSVYFAKWKKITQQIKQKKSLQASRDVLFGGSNAYLRQRCFTKWMNFSVSSRKKKALEKSAGILHRFGSRALTKVYFNKLRQGCRLRRLKREQSNNSAIQVLTKMVNGGLQKHFFDKWQAAATSKAQQKRSADAIATVLRSTSRGLMQLTFNKWVAFITVKKSQSSKSELQGLFQRQGDAGLRRVYLAKWVHFIREKHVERRRQHTESVMSRFSVTMIRSRVFQAWLARVLLKRRINFLLANASLTKADNVRLRYFCKWRNYSLSKLIKRSRGIRLSLDKQQASLVSCQQKQRDVSEEILTEKGRCLVSVAHGGELQHQLEQLRQKVQALEMRQTELESKHNTACRKLETAATKVLGYKRALDQQRRPPVPLVGEWYDDWRSMEKRLAALRKTIGNKELKPNDLYAQFQKLQDFAAAAKAAVVVGRDEHLHIDFSATIDDSDFSKDIAELLKKPLFNPKFKREPGTAEMDIDRFNVYREVPPAA